MELPPQTPYPVAPNGHCTVHRRNRSDVCIALAVLHASQQGSIRRIHRHLADPDLREPISDPLPLVDVEVSQVAPSQNAHRLFCSLPPRVRHQRTESRPAKGHAKIRPFSMAASYAASLAGQEIAEAYSLNELWFTTCSAGVSFGRYLSKNIYVSASHSTSDMQNRQSKIQYYLTPIVNWIPWLPPFTERDRAAVA